MSPRERAIPDLARSARRLFGLGVGALVLSAIAGAFDGRAFFQSYLWAWVLCAGPSFGAAILLMTHDLSGGRWGWSIHRVLRALLFAVPLLCVLFLPLLLGVGLLYPWATHHLNPGDALVNFRGFWLHAWFFDVRAITYLAIWALGAVMLWRASDPMRTPNMRLAAGGAVVYCLTVTFAFYDWIATLEPTWYSTIYGMYTIIGQALAALAVAIVLYSAAPRFVHRLSADRFHDMGNLLLALVVLWAYMAFSQFFIIWNGDLPEQSQWYLRRIEGGWRYVTSALMLFHFFLPFSALLFRATKRKRRNLLVVACIVLGAHVLDVTYRIVPAYESIGLWTVALGVLCAVGIGALVAAAFTFDLSRHPLADEASAEVEAT